jgi:hypothetical protein
MAKPLVLQYGGVDISFSMERTDRSRIYGYVAVEVLDEQGRRCELSTLADDGRTLVGRGGTALATLSVDGDWLERGQLKPVDLEGRPLVPVPSSLGTSIPLARKATIDEYLAHNVRSVYVLTAAADASALVRDLAGGTIYTFPFSFRGGLEPDAGFLLAGSDGTVFLALGQPTQSRFVGLDQAGAAVDEESPTEAAAAEEESLDFGMM